VEKQSDISFVERHTVLLSLLSIPECTLKEPIRFFDKIIPENLLNQMLVELVNAFSESDRIFEIKSESEIDQSKYIVIKRSKIGILDHVREYNLPEILKSIFQYHLRTAYYFLKEKAESDALVKSKKEFFQNIVLKLRDRWLSLRKIDHYNKYIEIYSFPFGALIFFIYNEYPLFAPKKSTEINDIFSYSEFSNQLYEKRDLNVSVIDDIMSLNDKKGKTLWIIYDEDTFRRNLKHFIYGQFDKISETIVFDQNAEAAYYLIYKLIQYTGKSESEKQLQSIFKIKGKMYSANSSYTAKIKISRRDNSLKQLIDNLIFLNLS